MSSPTSNPDRNDLVNNRANEKAEENGSSKIDGSAPKNDEGGAQSYGDEVPAGNGAKRSEESPQDNMNSTCPETPDGDALNLSPTGSDDNIHFREWLKVRDSLENLLASQRENEVDKGDDEKLMQRSKSTFSEPSLPMKGPGTTNDSAKISWDPWNKAGRKNKKEKPAPSCQSASNSPQADTEAEHYEGFSNMRKNSKNRIVNFLPDVMVVHVVGDQVLGQSTEPLKKELEQQERNKELRKGYTPATIGRSNLRKSASDYMAAWYKK